MIARTARTRPDVGAHDDVVALFTQPLETLFYALDASKDGLSAAVARARLAQFGFNEPTHAGAASIVALLVAPLRNPLVPILLIAAVISGFLGDRIGAALIGLMVALSCVLNSVLSYRSQRAAERLREAVVPTATVRRDGAWRELARRELVPGDVIRLSAGDRVPADARLIEARDLHVQQAALTGESGPIEKEAVAQPDPRASIVEGRGNVFLGTSVLAGTATALVVATGQRSQFGDIAESLSARPPETAFERGLVDFAGLIMRTVVILVLFVLLAGLALGRPPLQSLLFAVALAVGLTPEFMPMIMTVTLARGAVRMARRRVVVKHLAAIDGFGGMNILASDKTGTLTRGEMTLAAVVDGHNEPCDRVLSLARINSTFQTGIKSPLDKAILEQGCGDANSFRKLDEVPFDFERRRLSVIVEAQDKILLVAKGAPEFVLTQCTHFERHGLRLPLDAESAGACAATHGKLAEQGLRVLAVAYRELERKPRYAAADESNLVLAGFLAFIDPPLTDVGATLSALARDGIQIKILSGDDERVVRNVCANVGIDTERIVLGSELDALDQAELATLAERQHVFARVLPAQKHRIVLALKSRGHVVGFLGDGINDAPSLHAADIGISVSNAVDVAKDAADIVLGERDLSVLHAGVIEGRRAFGNVMKYLLMGTSSNFGNVFSMAAGVLFLPFLPMLPTQILLNNFLYDLAQVTIPTDNVDEAQLRQPQRWDIGLVRGFMWRMGPISSLYDFLTFYVLLAWFHAHAALFQTGWFIESLATQTLVLFVIRTFGAPWRSRPSLPLALSTIAIVIVAALVPFSPWAALLGFVPPPTSFLVFVAMATLTYLMLAEIAKRRFFSRHKFQLHPSTAPAHA